MKYLFIFFCFTLQADYSITQVIDTLMKAESSNGKFIHGDKLNGKYRAIGCLQIWQCTVDDANRVSKLKGYSYRFTYQDRYNVKKSRLMCRIVLINQIERWKINRGRLPNEYELAHSWKHPYKYSIHDFDYVKLYKNNQKI